MEKPAETLEPGARDIPAEFLLGKEDQGGEDTEPSNQDHAARQPTAAERRATLTKGDRLFLFGLVVLVVTGGALYLFRGDVASQYELRFHPERYWAGELDRRSFRLKMGTIQHEECLVDLVAARMKEPAAVARMKLLGADETSALKMAREEFDTQEQLCKVLADLVKQDRDSVTAAEREAERARAQR